MVIIFKLLSKLEKLKHSVAIITQLPDPVYNWNERHRLQYVKMYGERNSGTHAVQQLLYENLLNVTVLETRFFERSGWKHGFFIPSKYSDHNIDPHDVLFSNKLLNHQDHNHLKDKFKY